LNDLSLPRRFLKVSRNFGLAVAVKVTYSKIRGVLFPALALPDGRVYDRRPRQVSFLIDTAEHDAATVNAVVDVIGAHDGGTWEICICERPALPPEMARLLERLRGTQPWIRIVRADATIDGTTAARWIVEQATGQFIALVAPRYALSAEAIRGLLDQMHRDPELDAAALIGTHDEPEKSSLPAAGVDCRLVMQRKSGYLASQPERWPLTAPALVRQLHEAKVRTAYVRAG
jgi:hypothetical protein